eukprot:scaffold840_cov344-Pavlova_lutheri.AAC.100
MRRRQQGGFSRDLVHCFPWTVVVRGQCVGRIFDAGPMHLLGSVCLCHRCATVHSCGPSFVRLPVFHDPSFACVCCIHLGVGRFLLVPPSKGHLLHVHPSRDPTRIGFEPIDFPLDPPLQRPIGRGGMGMPRPQLHVQTHLEGVGRAWAHPEWDLHRRMANKRRPLCALPWTDATWKDGARTKERKDGT